MRNPKLMRRRANVSMLDLGRSKSDQGAMGKYCACIISIFPPFLEDDLLLHSGSVLLEYLLLIFMHAFVQWRSRRRMLNYLLKVSHYNVGCCAPLYGLLRTQPGSVSTQEFVKRTDRVPLMSALLLFNITTEHTLNSRHGAVPFDM